MEHEIRILVVEDEGIIARDIQRNLEELGHTVAGIANSGAEALEFASLIVVDLDRRGPCFDGHSPTGRNGRN